MSSVCMQFTKRVLLTALYFCVNHRKMFMAVTTQEKLTCLYVTVLKWNMKNLQTKPIHRCYTFSGITFTLDSWNKFKCLNWIISINIIRILSALEWELKCDPGATHKQVFLI